MSVINTAVLNPFGSTWRRKLAESNGQKLLVWFSDKEWVQLQVVVFGAMRGVNHYGVVAKPEQCLHQFRSTDYNEI